MHMGI